jgi:two-component system chemotaxis family response regulator WspR
MIDVLTGLPSRQRFAQFLGQDWRRADDEQSSIAVILIDVDFFHLYNTTLGREAGDACLRRIAGIIAGRVKRSSDLVARYEADRFVVVLAGADHAGVMGVAEWLRAEVESHMIPHGGSSVSDYVTVSVGFAVITPRAGARAEVLVASAEKALAVAKELGRNAVVAGSSVAGAS